MKENQNFSVNSILESIKCNICDSLDFQVIRLANYDQYESYEKLAKVYMSSSDNSLFDQIVKCRNCGLFFLNPRVSSNFFIQAYQNAVDVRHHEQDAFREKSFNRALRRIKKFLLIPLEGSEPPRLVDVGCAGGIFVKVARDYGFDSIGLELSKYLANYGKEKYGIEIYSTTLEKFAENPNLRKAQIISFWDVLEHLPDPKSTLSVTNFVLEDSGILILNLPMIDTFPARLLGKRWPFYLNVHTFYFTMKSISRLLDLCGFDVIDQKRYWQTLGLGYVFERAGIKIFARNSIFQKIPFRYYLGQRTILARKRTT